MERIPYLGQTIYRWQVGTSSFLALPEKGARLMNWNVTLGDGSVRDIIYWPEIATLENFANVRGGNPILFPFSGRSYDKGEIHHWRADDGVRRAMPIHGIARQGDFRVTRLDEGGFSAQFVPDAAAKELYPYDYEFVVSYRFDPLGVFVELQLTNLGTAPIPWSAGHHFYFTLPWSSGRTRKDYTLETTATKFLQRNEQGGLVPGPQINTRETLDNPKLVDLIHTGLKREVFAVTEEGSGARLFFRAGTANTNPRDLAVVTWTESDKAPFYCVEPWMGPPNAPETKIGLHTVAPGQTQKFYVEITLD
ncbi:aldose 1-epimerase [Oleiharenicola lentus]|uniref:aldose epimerase family protein n=1 Tax=Oleiharenicola lentus TaxID=2508720 RepID=UPI003F679E89